MRTTQNLGAAKAEPLPSRPSLEDYLKFDYPMELIRDRDEGDAWVASVPDLPGCNSYGDSVSEAVKNVTKMKALWIRGRYDSHLPIPEPSDEDDFSGKFVLRIPKSLHRSLAFQAQRQGVSLNHYASYLLSERHSNSQLHSIARMLEFCTHQVRSNSRNWRDRPMMIKANLPGDLQLLACIQKPPDEYSFKGTKKQLLGLQETGK
jgi:antitoxin HicB